MGKSILMVPAHDISYDVWQNTSFIQAMQPKKNDINNSVIFFFNMSAFASIALN